MLRALVAEGLLSRAEHRTVAALFRSAQQQRERPPPRRCVRLSSMAGSGFYCLQSTTW
jgi:hypothetical protein